MKLSTSLLSEFDREMANTRRTLARIPPDRLDWKPHPKSWPFAGLATHLANLPSWISIVMNQDSFDIAPPDQDPPRQAAAVSVDEVLEKFDANVQAARSTMEAAGDGQLTEPWSLLIGGEAKWTKPRTDVLRDMVLNHMIHHRGQLGVYLRLNDVSVPAIYGPSADEKA